MLDWQSVNGWLSAAEGECLARWARTCAEQHPRPVVVELGSYLGRSTALLADTLRQQDAQLWAVDRWSYKKGKMDDRYEKYPKGSYLPEFVQNMVRLGVMPFIQPVCAFTQDVAKVFEDRAVHMIFHDASHDHDGVADDVRAWLPKLLLGGIWVHHDYNRSGGRAIDECERLRLIEQVGVLAVFRNTSPEAAHGPAAVVAPAVVCAAEKVGCIHPLLRPRHSR